MQAAEATPSQATLHQSCFFRIASHRAYNVGEYFSLSYRALPRIFANPKESQLVKITQRVFQSGSN